MPSMFEDVDARLKKGNRILFSRESPCLQPLAALMQRQPRRVLVLWALDCARQDLERFEEIHPQETRPRACLDTSKAWARGRVKMPAARRAILDAHAAAKDFTDPEAAALCHAIGHAGATVHTGGHAIGLSIYALTALVRRHGSQAYREPVSRRIAHYEERLRYWEAHADKLPPEWADFLKD